MRYTTKAIGIASRSDNEMIADTSSLVCKWDMLRTQLLQQWRDLSEHEIDAAGTDLYALADLMQRKYGIAPRLFRNYLLNFARTLPLG
jgi:hypothetical protein